MNILALSSNCILIIETKCNKICIFNINLYEEESMDISDSIINMELENPNFDYSVIGNFGSFHTKNSFEVNYLLCSMNHKEINNLQVAADAFKFNQINFDEMVQREIDEKRVNNEIVGQYLEDDINKALFFPPLIVSLVAFDNNDRPIHKFTQSIESYDNSKTFHVFRKRWDKHFEIEIPISQDSLDRYKSEENGVISIFKNGVKLKCDSRSIKLVVIDGQHRLKAVQEYLRRNPDQKDFITLPVCICFSPKAIEKNGAEDILDTLRNMFVTINNKGKQVSGHYIDLLNDASLASHAVRSLANLWKSESENSIYSTLQFMEWNQRNDSKARRVNRPYSITTVSMLADSLKSSVFETRKNGNLHEILQLQKYSEDLYDTELSLHDIQENNFTYKQKATLYKVIDNTIVPNLNTLLTSPSVYKSKISSYKAAIADCFDKSQKSVAGYPSFILAMERFGDIDRQMHTEEAVKASNYFYSCIVDSEHLENYTRLVFNQAYLRAWADIMCISKHFIENISEFTNSYISALEKLCFSEKKQVFSKSRIYNQLTLYKGSKPNTTMMGKDCWYHLLMMTLLNSDSFEVFETFLAKKQDVNSDSEKLKILLENSQRNFMHIMREEVLKDNIQNWKIKDYPVPFRRQLEEYEKSGDDEALKKSLEKKTVEQLDERIDLISNVLEINLRNDETS